MNNMPSTFVPPPYEDFSNPNHVPLQSGICDIEMPQILRFQSHVLYSQCMMPYTNMIVGVSLHHGNDIWKIRVNTP